MVANVKIIKKVEGRVDRRNGGVLNRLLRVTAYARVSTDDEDQRNSYQSQLMYFKSKIKENSEWIYIDMYADEVKDQDLLSLFTLQNYEISKTPEISRNRSAGTITIVFSINQVDPGQGQTRVAIYNDGSDSISDNQKIIFIKNFKIPFSPVTQYIPAIILSIALVVLVLIIMMLITKSRTSVIENPLSRKRKKFKKLTRIKK